MVTLRFGNAPLGSLLITKVSDDEKHTPLSDVEFLLTDSSGVRLSKRQKGITWRELHRDGMSAAGSWEAFSWLAGALSRPESFRRPPGRGGNSL